MAEIDLAKLKVEEEARWAQMKLVPAREAGIVKRAGALCAPEAKARYLAIEQATSVPWFVVAVVHEREAGGPPHWDRQLAQGDPLDKPSTHVPVGRGPFFNHSADPPGQDAFYRGAIDALVDCPPHTARNVDWSIGGTLVALVQYNGLGYAERGVPSPYLWAGTDRYAKGKFVSDGKFDPEAVDGQDGCAALLFAMSRIDASVALSAPAPPAAAAAPGTAPAVQPLPKEPSMPSPAPAASAGAPAAPIAPVVIPTIATGDGLTLDLDAIRKHFAALPPVDWQQGATALSAAMPAVSAGLAMVPGGEAAVPAVMLAAAVLQAAANVQAAWKVGPQTAPDALAADLQKIAVLLPGIKGLLSK